MLRTFLCSAWLGACVCLPSTSRGQELEKEQILWQKLEASIKETDQKLDGVMGVAILDLATGRTLLFHADEVLPTASSIKIAILAELYHQAQQGKLRLGVFATTRGLSLPGSARS